MSAHVYLDEVKDIKYLNEQGQLLLFDGQKQYGDSKAQVVKKKNL